MMKQTCSAFGSCEAASASGWGGEGCMTRRGALNIGKNLRSGGGRERRGVSSEDAGAHQRAANGCIDKS